VKIPPPSVLLWPASRQLSIPFDSARLRGMTPAEPRISLARLASLLLEAAGIAAGGVTMTSADLLPAAVLKRKAVVYIRQSTQAQVQTSLESQRRQYELVDVARQRGFRDIDVIEDNPFRQWHDGATRVQAAAGMAGRRRSRGRANRCEVSSSDHDHVNRRSRRD